MIEHQIIPLIVFQHSGALHNITLFSDKHQEKEHCLYIISTFCSKLKITFRNQVALPLKMNENGFRQVFLNPSHALIHFSAFCPSVNQIPGENLILPIFSSLSMVAISVPFPEVRNRKGTESGLWLSKI